MEFGAGFEEAVGRRGEVGVLDGGAVASHEDGVHNRERAADAEGEAEEEADEAGVEAHSSSWHGRLLPVVVAMT